jgi:MFS family permease
MQPQVLGLAVIYSLFFFHQRARAINLWAFSFLLGPYLGPLISGFVINKLDWRQTFGVLCGMYGFSVLMIVLLGRESTWNRDGLQKPRKGGVMGRIEQLVGITGFKEAADRNSTRPGLLEVVKDQFGLLSRPYVLLPSK